MVVLVVLSTWLVIWRVGFFVLFLFFIDFDRVGNSLYVLIMTTRMVAVNIRGGLFRIELLYKILWGFGIFCSGFFLC